MAEYLIQDSTLAAIGNAIRAKEGTSDAIQVSELASRIAAIETGITVRRKTGTFKVNSSGTVTVACGFKPDLVLVHKSEVSTSDDQYIFTAAAAFNEDSRIGSNYASLALWSSASGTSMYELDLERNDTGFKVVESYAYTASWADSTPSNVTFNYVAVKYT